MNLDSEIERRIQAGEEVLSSDYYYAIPPWTTIRNFIAEFQQSVAFEVVDVIDRNSYSDANVHAAACRRWNARHADDPRWREESRARRKQKYDAVSAEPAAREARRLKRQARRILERSRRYEHLAS